MLRILLPLLIVIAAIFFATRTLSHTTTPAAGTPAPDFTLPSPDGTVTLHDYRGRWVVLYFYPKDQTPG